MENNQDLLARLEANSRQQLLFTKILCGLLAAILICAVVLTIVIAGAAGEISALAEQASIVLDNLDTVTWELASTDFSTMVANMGTLAAESQNIVAEAMKKLDAIDIDSLNSAIQDLADIVAPLAKISNIFG